MGPIWGRQGPGGPHIDPMYFVICGDGLYLSISVCRNHFMCAPRQWETTLQCNVVSRWLGACTKWSLSVSGASRMYSFAAILSMYYSCIIHCNIDLHYLSISLESLVMYLNVTWDVLTWKRFPHYWSFCEISLLLAWKNCSTQSRVSGD